MPVDRSHQSQWLDSTDCELQDLRDIVEVNADAADYRHAASVEHGTVVYDGADIPTNDLGHSDDERRRMQSEIATVLLDGPGIVLFREAIDPDVVDAASAVFEKIITDEREALPINSGAAGDHFAKPGANDRVWNALEKFALRSPHEFASYYQAPAIALAADAWLGPGYQLTSQVNVVNPGAEAQEPHRDYHLGFMTIEEAERYPSHVHRLSPALTLQGAVAHCDMPVETGPTMYLPHSQKYEAGYLAWRRPEFREYFAAHHVQLPLRKGDAVFFNPALFHAAGTNTTPDVRRMANLLQVSSAFGRAMERVDRIAMTMRLFPVLVDMQFRGLPTSARDRIIAACAEGYSFPANLDVKPPVGALSPPSQADLLRQALEEQWLPDRLATAIGYRRPEPA